MGPEPFARALTKRLQCVVRRLPALAALAPALAMAGFVGAGTGAPQVQGPSQILSSQPLVLTFHYYAGGSGTPSYTRYSWQYWYCTPGHDGAPSNTNVDETPFPGHGCTSQVLKNRSLDPNGAVQTITPAQHFDAGTVYARARLSSPQHGNGPWGPWHRTAVQAVAKNARFAKPVFSLPHEGAQFVGKDVTLALQSGTKRQDSDNWQYQLQWQRAKVVTRFNDDYVRSHTPAGQIPQTDWPGPRAAWNGPGRPTTVGGFPGQTFAYLKFNVARPRSHTFGYRYWVRAREHDLPTDTSSPWSGWLSFVVQEKPGAKLPKSTAGTPRTRRQQRPTRGRVQTQVALQGLKPPLITAPTGGQVFHSGKIVIRIALPKHTDRSKWQCCDYQIDRARVITKENNAYVKNHTPPGSVMQSDFPSPRARLDEDDPLAPESASSGPWTWSWSVSQYRPHSHKFGYRYWVRVREHYLPAKAPGPWSAWRSFIVQEPLTYTVLPRAGGALPGASQNQQHSGQKQRRQLAPNSPTRRLSLPMQQPLNR
ncbi:MAG: hypothetical protein P8076_05280 [Gammaproteobacteria bacterium]